MNKLFYELLISFAFINFCSVFAMEDLSEEDQVAIAIALSQDSVRTAPPPHAFATRDFSSEGLVRRMVAEEARKQAENDAATAALIRRMAIEDERTDRRMQVPVPEEMDAATAALIAAMTLEDASAGPRIVTHAVGGLHRDPIFHQVRAHKDVAIHRALLAPIVTLLERVSHGVDVHTLDGHVVANMVKLHTMGDAFGIDNPALTVPEMRAYLLAHSDFYKDYERQVVTGAQLTGYIDAALARASEQASTLGMYSRVISLTQRLKPDDRTMYLKRLLDAISENYLTAGGCFQGVRNRIYVRYVDMMNNLMGHG